MVLFLKRKDLSKSCQTLFTVRSKKHVCFCSSLIVSSTVQTLIFFNTLSRNLTITNLYKHLTTTVFLTVLSSKRLQYTTIHDMGRNTYILQFFVSSLWFCLIEFSSKVFNVFIQRRWMLLFFFFSKIIV